MREDCEGICPECGLHCEFADKHKGFHLHFVGMGERTEDGDAEWVCWHMWYVKGEGK